MSTQTILGGEQSQLQEDLRFFTVADPETGFERWNPEEIEDQVDLVVQAMANTHFANRTYRSFGSRSRNAEAAWSIINNATAKMPDGHRVAVIMTRPDTAPREQLREQVVDLSTIHIDDYTGKLTFDGGVLFRDLCASVASGDRVRVTHAGHRVDGALKEEVYATTYPEVDFKYSQYLHLSASERKARGIADRPDTRAALSKVGLKHLRALPSPEAL